MASHPQRRQKDAQWALETDEHKALQPGSRLGNSLSRPRGLAVMHSCHMTRQRAQGSHLRTGLIPRTMYVSPQMVVQPSLLGGPHITYLWLHIGECLLHEHPTALLPSGGDFCNLTMFILGLGSEKRQSEGEAAKEAGARGSDTSMPAETCSLYLSALRRYRGWGWASLQPVCSRRKPKQ